MATRSTADGAARTTSSSAAAIAAAFPDIVPGITFAGYDAPFRWNDISPRVGATWALDDSRKTILRASFNRTAGQLDSSIVGYSNLSSNPGFADYGWIDANGDHLAQAGALDPLHRQEGEPPRLAGAEQPDHVGVPHPRQHGDLAPEALRVRPVPERPGREELDRDGPALVLARPPQHQSRGHHARLAFRDLKIDRQFELCGYDIGLRLAACEHLIRLTMGSQHP